MPWGCPTKKRSFAKLNVPNSCHSWPRRSACEEHLSGQDARVSMVSRTIQTMSFQGMCAGNWMKDQLIIDSLLESTSWINASKYVANTWLDATSNTLESTHGYARPCVRSCRHRSRILTCLKSNCAAGVWFPPPKSFTPIKPNNAKHSESCQAGYINHSNPRDLWDVLEHSMTIENCFDKIGDYFVMFWVGMKMIIN